MTLNSKKWNKIICVGISFLSIAYISSFYMNESSSENRVECSSLQEMDEQVPPYILLMREEIREREQALAQESSKMMKEQTEECNKPFREFMEYLEESKNLNQKRHALNLP